jgi:hypothetical protein
MTEQSALRTAIRIIGLWRIFESAANNLYYVAIKQLGLPTASTLPVKTDIEGLVFNLVVGVLIVAAAPALVQMICGGKSAEAP